MPRQVFREADKRRIEEKFKNRMNCRIQLMFDGRDLDMYYDEFKEIVTKWADDYGLLIYGVYKEPTPAPKIEEGFLPSAMAQLTLEAEEVEVKEKEDLIDFFRVSMESREIDGLDIKILSQRLDYDLNEVLITVK